MLAYLTILTTALAGLAGAPWWAAVICGCLLALISITEHQRFASRLEAVSATGILTAASFISLGHGLMAGGSAFLLGKFTGLFWEL